MATKIMMMRQFRGLVPIDSFGVGEVEKMSMDEVISVTFSRPRNVAHHRKFWKLMQMVFEAQSSASGVMRFADQEKMVNAIKIGIGYFDEYTDRAGRVVIIPHSISFAKMDQAAFERFYNDVIAFVLERILPNVRRRDFENEFLSVVDGVDYNTVRRIDLPPPSWREVLECELGDSVEIAEAHFRNLARRHHPDQGGTHERMVELTNAIEQARREIGRR